MVHTSADPRAAIRAQPALRCPHPGLRGAPDSREGCGLATAAVAATRSTTVRGAVPRSRTVPGTAAVWSPDRGLRRTARSHFGRRPCLGLPSCGRGSSRILAHGAAGTRPLPQHRALDLLAHTESGRTCHRELACRPALGDDQPDGAATASGPAWSIPRRDEPPNRCHVHQRGPSYDPVPTRRFGKDKTVHLTSAAEGVCAATASPAQAATSATSARPSIRPPHRRRRVADLPLRHEAGDLKA